MDDGPFRFRLSFHPQPRRAASIAAMSILFFGFRIHPRAKEHVGGVRPQKNLLSKSERDELFYGFQKQAKQFSCHAESRCANIPVCPRIPKSVSVRPCKRSVELLGCLTNKSIT